MIIHFPERDDILIFLDFLLFSFRDFGMVITVLPVLSQYQLFLKQVSVEKIKYLPSHLLNEDLVLRSPSMHTRPSVTPICFVLSLTVGDVTRRTLKASVRGRETIRINQELVFQVTSDLSTVLHYHPTPLYSFRPDHLR